MQDTRVSKLIKRVEALEAELQLLKSADLPPLPKGLLTIAEEYPTLGEALNEMRQQCYAAGLAAKNQEHADLLVTLREQQDEIRALREREEAAAKRAPMTREQWLEVLRQRTTYRELTEEHGLVKVRTVINLLIEASSGLTLAQAREMALGCVPPTKEQAEMLRDFRIKELNKIINDNCVCYRTSMSNCPVHGT